MNFTPPDLSFFKELERTRPNAYIRLPEHVYVIPNKMAGQKIPLKRFIELLESAFNLKFEKVEYFLNMATKHDSESFLLQACVDDTNANYMFHTFNKAVIL